MHIPISKINHEEMNDTVIHECAWTYDLIIIVDWLQVTGKKHPVINKHAWVNYHCCWVGFQRFIFFIFGMQEYWDSILHKS